MKSTIKLRRWNAEDASRLFEFAQDELLEHQINDVTTPESASECISNELVVNSERMVWCIDLDGDASGLVGINYSAAQGNGKFDRGWVYYWAADNLRGRKIMKPVVRAVCDFAQEIEITSTMFSVAGYSVDISELFETSSPCLRRLELGYRTNNPASRAVALGIGFVEEGLEREKFCYEGELFDAVVAARLLPDIPGCDADK